ncbi:MULTISPECIES: hypothetical protein [Micrococcus]|uniref:hypothetical protein n=1 Tax=Micrococcus luteus TaxID=1270 RepID=UPI0010AECC32|nr:hypothetical protein [Micrococcus luteus]HAQ4537977.1 hypothetical protein [Enterococcus faecium]MBN6846366.1 hypothetical protein [Micrococcus luteus]MBY0207815.1 hypothetical protein [Micrococcus luteus]MCV7718379.1 hypothetical protein [Micrococcus luteus]MCV7720563.1 hypothetical protein [Micrococcus luteus]
MKLTSPARPASGEVHHSASYVPLEGAEAVFPALRQRALAPGGRLYGLAAAAAVGGLTLLDPHARRGRERRVLAELEAAVSGTFLAAETASALHTAAIADGEVVPSSAARALRGLGGLAVGGAVAAVALRATGLNDRVDGAVVRGLQRAGVPAPRVALAAAASLAMLLANEDARRTRRDAVELAVTGPAGLDGDTVDEVEPEATAELPVEVRVLLETLLDPALAEGRDLPGAEALRSQLPHARTVTSVAEAIREAGEVPDWVPLVVETDDDIRRAVPNDCVWPVRGRFASGSAGGHELELRLQVIDGEIGALTVTLPANAEADSDAWDAFQEIESFPGVEDLTFHVDGDRRA